MSRFSESEEGRSECEDFLPCFSLVWLVSLRLRKAIEGDRIPFRGFIGKVSGDRPIWGCYTE
jgi:hypothetical protein